MGGSQTFISQMTDDLTKLDAIDRRIVRALQEKGRSPIAAIADRLSLSRSAVSERMKRLEQQGIIQGYRAQINPRVTGRTLEVFVGIRARQDADRAQLEAWLLDQPAVFEALHLTGRDDYLLRVRCRDTAELDALLMRMKTEAGVAETETRVVLRTLGIAPKPSSGWIV